MKNSQHKHAYLHIYTADHHKTIRHNKKKHGITRIGIHTFYFICSPNISFPRIQGEWMSGVVLSFPFPSHSEPISQNENVTNRVTIDFSTSVKWSFPVKCSSDFIINSLLIFRLRSVCCYLLPAHMYPFVYRYINTTIHHIFCSRMKSQHTRAERNFPFCI